MADPIIEAAQKAATIAVKPLLEELLQTNSDDIFNQLILRLLLPISETEQSEIAAFIEPLRQKKGTPAESKDVVKLTSIEWVVLGIAELWIFSRVDGNYIVECFNQANTQDANGNAFAQYCLGCIYRYALRGVEQDFEKACEYFRAAADPLGACNIQAMVQLADIAEVVEADVVTAHIADRKNTKKMTNAMAQYQLGLICLSGNGYIGVDMDQAYQLISSSARQGFAPALRQLGKMYLYAIGVPENKPLAVEYFSAADQLSGNSNSSGLYKYMVFFAHIFSINNVGEKVYSESFKDYSRGACNGFVVMHARAHVQGDESHLQNRLERLRKMSYKEVVRMGELYSDDKTESKSEVDNSLLEFAKELYVFLHSLLFAQLPTKTQFKVPNGKVASQFDWQEVLSFFLPQNCFTTKVFSFVIQVTKAEIHRIIDQLIFPGDMVKITDKRHAVFLIKKADQFVLANNDKDYIFTDSDKLAAMIQGIFLLHSGLPAKYLNIYIQVIRSDRQHISRPSVEAVLQNILSDRGHDNHINGEDWTKESTLYHAIHLRHPVDPTVKFLLANGADPNLVSGREKALPITLQISSWNTMIMLALAMRPQLPSEPGMQRLLDQDRKLCIMAFHGFIQNLSSDEERAMVLTKFINEENLLRTYFEISQQKPKKYLPKLFAKSERVHYRGKYLARDVYKCVAPFDGLLEAKLDEHHHRSKCVIQ